MGLVLGQKIILDQDLISFKGNYIKFNGKDGSDIPRTNFLIVQKITNIEKVKDRGKVIGHMITVKFIDELPNIPPEIYEHYQGEIDFKITRSKTFRYYMEEVKFLLPFKQIILPDE